MGACGILWYPTSLTGSAHFACQAQFVRPGTLCAVLQFMAVITSIARVGLNDLFERGPAYFITCLTARLIRFSLTKAL